MRPVRSARTRAVGWLAAAAIVMIAILNGAPQFSNASIPPRGIPDSGLALQVARNIGEVDAILGEAPSPDREAMRIKQYLDFGFIAVYAGLYIALGRLFGSRLAAAGAACGVAAAICDVFENLAILRILKMPLRQTTQAMIDSIRHPSLAKWSLAFAAAAIFAALFLREKSKAMRFIGTCEAIAAALGFYGLLDNAFLFWAGIPLLAGLVALVVMFVAAPLILRR
jgi:hypothetical protein